MRAKTRVLSIALGFALIFASQAFAADLTIYTSMKQSLVDKLRAAFEKQNPELSVNWVSDSAGKLMVRIAAERKSGKIEADALWTSEVPDFYALKAEGLLEKYVSPVASRLTNPFPDFDGSFTAVRLGTMGIAYNRKLVRKPPASWQDLLAPDNRGFFYLANPAESGTAYMAVTLLAKCFGWEFFEKLAANGAHVGAGVERLVDDVATGRIPMCLAVDYIANDRIARGADMALVYPREMLVVPSPVAILKKNSDTAAAKKLVDYLLSREAQEIVAREGTLPTLAEAASQKLFIGLPAAIDAMARAIPIDYAFVGEKEKNLAKFARIMKGKK